MPNYFGGKAIPDMLKKELDARRDVTALNEWFASKVTWVYLTSMCQQCDPSITNLTGLGTYAYEDKTEFSGLRPNPVITNVKVTAQGNLGTTRKASISLIAFTEEQLEKLNNCYLISGMSVRVEFGWSVGAYQSKRAPAPIKSPQTIQDSLAVCRINKQREQNPMYDGLQGIVGKWDIKYNKDAQYWEVTIDLIATSSPVLTLPLRDMSSTCTCEEKQQDPQGSEETVKVERSAFDFFIHELIRLAEEEGDSDVRSHVKSELGLEKGGCVLPLNGPTRTADGADVPAGWLRSLGNMFFGSMIQSPKLGTKEAYITLQALFTAIQKLSFTQKDSKDGSIYCKFDLSKFGKGSRKGNFFFSCDPHVCLFPGGDHAKYDAYDGIDDPGKVESCVLGDQGVDLSKILVNVIFVSSVLQKLGNKPTVQDFLSQILSGINQASGNLWELTVIDIADCEGDVSVPVLSVIDVSRHKKDDMEYVVVGKANNKTQPGIIRDISLQLKLSSAMQSRALYASTRQEVTEDPCADNQLKRDQAGFVNLAAPKPTEAPKKINCGDKCKPTSNSTEDVQGEMIKAINQVRRELTQQHKDNLYTKVVKFNNQGAEESQCKEMIVPYELSLTFDGIGGFSFGQLINCDLVPKRARDRYTYQIIEVAHDLSYGDWVTSVKCVARYK